MRQRGREGRKGGEGGREQIIVRYTPTFTLGRKAISGVGMAMVAQVTITKLCHKALAQCKGRIT